MAMHTLAEYNEKKNVNHPPQNSAKGALVRDGLTTLTSTTRRNKASDIVRHMMAIIRIFSRLSMHIFGRLHCPFADTPLLITQARHIVRHTTHERTKS